MGYLIDIDAWQARKNRQKFLDEIFWALNRRAEAMFKYYAQESWDLFVAHFMDTDRLHHFLWGDVARGDVAYTAWFNRFYARVDEIIGELVSRVIQRYATHDCVGSRFLHFRARGTFEFLAATDGVVVFCIA